jgi:hypothetical protein
MMKRAREEHVEALQKRQESMQEAKQLQLRLGQLREELEAAQKRTGAGAAPACPLEKAVNTEPMQAPSELTELQAEVGQRNAELEEARAQASELKAEVANLRRSLARARKGPPPPGCTTEPPIAVSLVGSSEAEAAPPSTSVHNQVNNTVVNQVLVPSAGFAPQASTDLGTDPNGEAAVEALIGQTAGALRALAAMARASAYHKQAASDMWAELCGMKQAMPAPHQHQYNQGFYDSGGRFVPNPQAGFQELHQRRRPLEMNSAGPGARR